MSQQWCCAGSPVAPLQSAEGLQGSACLKLHCLLLPPFSLLSSGLAGGFLFFFSAHTLLLGTILLFLTPLCQRWC